MGFMSAQPEEDFTPDEMAAFAKCDAWVKAGSPGAMSHEEFMAELGVAQ
jgi:hypothetical protein